VTSLNLPVCATSQLPSGVSYSDAGRSLDAKPRRATMTDAPPDEVREDLQRLRTALDQAIPARELDRNLLLGTWNIRAFGGLTEKWKAEDDDSPKRDLHALYCVAEIVSRFDVVAIQEVKADLKALRHMLKVLGPDWGLILTDVTLGARGNDERLAFVFDTRRVKPSGLAGELVVPDEWKLEQGVLDRQFARTPYAVSFISAGRTFILVTLHVLFGDKPEDRLAELRTIAKWLGEWAGEISAWGHNLICLGDFNIDRRDDPSYRAFVSTGLRPPQELNEVPRSIFSGSAGKFYDQVAWFTGELGSPKLSLRYTGRAGGFNFTGVVLQTLTTLELSWRLSDHMPLWVEFDTKPAPL